MAVGTIAAAVIWIRLAIRPSSDLLNHQEFGRRFVDGEFLYEGGLDYPYLPIWALAHAPLTLVPPGLVTALVFPFGLAALLALLWILDRLSRESLPIRNEASFWVAAAALALTSRFVIRDLLDGGANLVLTALVWGALVAWQQRREWTAGMLLGSAIALKLTAGVFLIVLMAWRAQGWLLRTTAWALLLLLLPAMGMGVDRYAGHLDHWWTRVSAGLVSLDPAVGVLGAEPIGNLALRPAVGRWLIEDTASPAARARVAFGSGIAVLAILAGLAIWTWRRARTAPAVAWAAAGIVALLVSPITWRAHLVAILPACYLLIRHWAANARLVPLAVVALAAVAIPGLLLARGLAGDAVSRWSDRWSITTLALCLLLVGVAAWPTRR